MGNSGSSLVDCVQEGDTQRIKEQLSDRLVDLRDGEITQEELHNEVEDAIHAALSMEITTPQQYQQLQIAVELMLHVAPTALKTSECNSVGWTALHRACVTGNLSFIAFLFMHHAQHIEVHRDAFGLLPSDLIPPELGGLDLAMQAEEPKSLPSTNHDRVAMALNLLRQGKQDLERLALQLHMHPPGSSSGNQQEDDEVECQGKKPAASYAISFEPKRDRLPREMHGTVHQLTSPLRIRYCLPRTDSIFHGYFQLIWRTDSEPRSEEPHYENHVLLRESIDVDHPAPTNQDLPPQPRRLYDAKDSDPRAEPLVGYVPMDVSQLPHDAVCHVLFVASDKYLMKREIVLSTDGVRLVQPDPLDVEYTGEYDDEIPYEFGVESDGESEGFVFHVAGEAFTHPSEKLAGLLFETVAEFEDFVKELRVPAKPEVAETTRTHVKSLLLSLPSNQDDDQLPGISATHAKKKEEDDDNQRDDGDELDELWEIAG